MKECYYKPSGRCSVMFILFYLGLVVLAIPILSVAYIYLVYYIPYVYLNLIIVVLCGAGLGFVMNLAIRKGKLRNPVLALIMTILAVCIMKYVQWCVYIPLVYSDAYEAIDLTFLDVLYNAFDFLRYPLDVLIYALEINEYGVWSYGRNALDNVHGGMLFFVWFMEFVCIAISAVAVVWEESRLPFSEDAGNWYTKMREKVRANVPIYFDSMKTNLENGDFTELKALVKEYKPEQTVFAELTIYEPPEDAGTAEPYYLTIHNVKISYDRKNKENRSAKKLLHCIAIDAQDARELSNSAY